MKPFEFVSRTVKYRSYGRLKPGPFWRNGMGLHSLQTDILKNWILESANANIVELGSGGSTQMMLSVKSPFSLTSLDHDPEYAFSGTDERLDLHIVPLLQWSEVEFEQMLLSGQFSKSGTRTPERITFRTERCFYDLTKCQLPKEIDILLIDGPNGSGRLLGCSVLTNRLVAGSRILIDDVNHFPFEEILSRHFRYEVEARIVSRSIHPLFGFTALRITEPVKSSRSKV